MYLSTQLQAGLCIGHITEHQMRRPCCTHTGIEYSLETFGFQLRTSEATEARNTPLLLQWLSSRRAVQAMQGSIDGQYAVSDDERVELLTRAYAARAVGGPGTATYPRSSWVSIGRVRLG